MNDAKAMVGSSQFSAGLVSGQIAAGRQRHVDSAVKDMRSANAKLCNAVDMLVARLSVVAREEVNCGKIENAPVERFVQLAAEIRDEASITFHQASRIEILLDLLEL